jgi:lactate dehydrogenase-like 2-hydroxyacid dehydrogenase
MQPFLAYIDLLAALSKLLSSVGERFWSGQLDKWTREAEQLVQKRNKDLLKEHLRRTKRSLVGMGSIGDITISCQAGLAKTYSVDEARKIDEQIEELTDSLYKTTIELLTSIDSPD